MHERAEVTEIQAAGVEIGLEIAASVHAVDLKVPGQIAGSDRPVDLGEGVAVAVPVQLADQMEGRGVGQGQPGEVIKIGEVASRDVQGRIDPTQIEGLGQNPVRDQPRLAGPHVGVKVVGLSGVDVQQRRAGDGQKKGPFVDGALADQLK